MKPYILLVFLFIFSIGFSQNEPEFLEAKNKIEIVTVEKSKSRVKVVEVEQIVARSRSDIRVYFNQKRKISNFNLLFYNRYRNRTV